MCDEPGEARGWGYKRVTQERGGSKVERSHQNKHFPWMRSHKSDRRSEGAFGV